MTTEEIHLEGGHAEGLCDGGGMVTIWCGEKLKEEQEDHVCC